MINRKLAVSVLALTVAAGGASAQSLGSSSFSAGVALLSPEPTGFRYQAQLGVDGLGTGAVTLAATKAKTTFSGFAGAATVPNGIAGADEGTAFADAGILGSLEFDRNVTTNGNLVGAGNVLALGDATASTGLTGAAFGAAEAAGIDGATGDIFSSSAEVETEAGLSGSLNTRNRLNLVGREAAFVADLGTSIGEESDAFSVSAARSFAQTGFGLGGATPANAVAALADFNTFAAPFVDDGGTDVINPGGFTNFSVSSVLDGAGAGGAIDLEIEGVADGSQLLDVSTGGFFTGGAAAFGDNSFGFID